MLHPGTKQPIGPDDLAVIFPRAVIEQEMSTEREIEIPEPVRDVYRQWRPSPLFRARRLEKALDTPAKIYYKYEGVSPAGSHKPNTAIPQAFYNKEAGRQAHHHRDRRRPVGLVAGPRRRLLRPRDRGLHGQGELPAEALPPRLHGDLRRRAASPAPATRTESGRAILAEHPDSTGSLGIAISEAVEVAAQRDDTKYALGSVLNHVLLHQTVIGLEAIEAAGDGRRLPGHDHRLHRRRQQLRRHRLPVPRRASCAAARRSNSSPSSRPPARP